VTRLVGMIVFFGALLAGLCGLAWAFYLFAGWLALVFARNGAPPEWGAAVANLLTLNLVVLMIPGSLLSVAERKWSALIQNRVGCNRIRFFGTSAGGMWFLLADALKMLTKERFTPGNRTKFLFDLAPVLAFAPIFALFAIVPVGAGVPLGKIVEAGGALGQVSVALQLANPDAGLLYLFAIASLSVYGTSLAGWSSNNKFALLGSVRAASQMISYEVSLGLSLVGTMIAFRTLRLEEMVAAQGQAVLGPVPALGILLQPIGFLVFFASAFAETKRAPFDLPEGESEIVGYFVEYSGMQFGLMFLSEFVEIVVLSGIVTAVFLGGSHPVLFEGWLKANLSPLWKDVFLFHWKEESQHAIVDEMEWMREDQRLDAAQRDQAVDELIGLVGAVDGIVQMQANADAQYFVRVVGEAGRVFDAAQAQAIHAALLSAYRWQYIVTGVQDPRFLEVLGSMINAEHGARIGAALAPIVGAVH